MHLTRLHRVVAGAVAITLLATACGSDAANQTSPEAPAETGAPADADELDAIMSQSASMIDTDPTLSLLLALEANRRLPGSVTEQAILDSLGASTGVSITASLPIAPPDAQGCGDLVASEDGLQIYQVVDGRLMNHDLSAGEVTDHGPALEPCSIWMEDHEVGRMVASDGAGGWFLGSPGGSDGPLFGPLDKEVAYDRRILLAGRTMAGERMVFVAFDASGITMVVFDTTTGEVVAEIEGLAEPVSVTYGSDGSHIAFTKAVPGAGGQAVVLDAQTGDEVVRVDLVESGEESRFDLATGEIVLATEGGRLLTVDIEAGRVVADVATAGTTEVAAVGIRPDGLVVIAREDMIEIVDRRTGPTGVTAPLDESVAMRVQPDGSVMRITMASETEIINIDGNGLAGQTPEEWLARACEIAGRDFTQAEWDEFVLGDQTLQSACA